MLGSTLVAVVIAIVVNLFWWNTLFSTRCASELAGSVSVRACAIRPPPQAVSYA
jgi:hypothetical protein